MIWHEIIFICIIGLFMFYWGYLIGTLKAGLVIKRHEIKKHLEKMEEKKE